MARKKKMQLTYIERPDGKIPVAGYARVSSPGQDVENSIGAQIVNIRSWAEDNGYIIVRMFIDKAKTGRIAKRPDFQEMIEIAERPDCPVRRSTGMAVLQILPRPGRKRGVQEPATKEGCPRNLNQRTRGRLGSRTAHGRHH